MRNARCAGGETTVCPNGAPRVAAISSLDAYHLSGVTLTTVGYGDFSPQTTLRKVFTTRHMFSGVGIITTYMAYRMRCLSGHLHPKAELTDAGERNRVVPVDIILRSADAAVLPCTAGYGVSPMR
ncbi:MAG: potassium channel family protein [Actinomycetia bacterium]|nr:potassium channel family protein [Actinomycetes bacterium]